MLKCGDKYVRRTNISVVRVRRWLIIKSSNYWYEAIWCIFYCINHYNTLLITINHYKALKLILIQ